MDAETKALIRRLVAVVCDQAEFDEDKAYVGLERAVDYDWQKSLVTVVGQLDTQANISDLS